jgi:hypothetical protein
MPKQSNQLNLLNLFQTATTALTQNQQDLNQADTYNHDHGDNMVEVFNVITQAMQAKRGATPADQLAYASQLLRQKQSGSAQLYSQGLSQASKEFVGQKKITPNSAVQLVQTLMGAGQATNAQQPQAGGMGDLLGSLLGGGQTAQPQAQAGTGDLLNALLGGDGQQQPAQQADQGVDMGDLLNAGMAFMNTKQQGGNNLQAAVNALVASSAMGNSPHRTQSGNLVANTLLSAIGSLAGRK